MKDTMFTPTEKRIVDLLSDGVFHSREEVHKCLSDDLALPNGSAISFHVAMIRRKLRPQGMDIVSSQKMYGLVRVSVATNS